MCASYNVDKDVKMIILSQAPPAASTVPAPLEQAAADPYQLPVRTGHISRPARHGSPWD